MVEPSKKEYRQINPKRIQVSVKNSVNGGGTG